MTEEQIQKWILEDTGEEQIQKILSAQNEDGSWGEEGRFYSDKYHGTVWQLLVLAELGASGEDARIKRGCEFLLDHSQEPKTFGFSVEMSKTTKYGLPGKVIPCLTGNMIFALLRFGYLNDPRIQGGIQWILQYQTTDDGDGEHADGLYAYHSACFGEHTCFMGVVKCLKALSVIPKEKRTKDIEQKIQDLAEFMLLHHIYKQSHDLSKNAKPGWSKFGFPLMYQTDVLEIMDILTSLEIHDERKQEAYQLIEKKRMPDGRWILQNTYNGKMVVDVEVKNEPSRWITARAMRVLRGKSK